MGSLAMSGSGCVACVALGLALGATGCLSDDTSVPPPPITLDGALPEASIPTYDASGSVDGAGNPPPDAAPDALPPVDASIPDAGVDAADAAPIPDAAPDASEAGVSILGLVPGGATAQSPHYIYTGNTGAAHSPLLKSPNYQLVGGVSVTSQQP